MQTDAFDLDLACELTPVEHLLKSRELAELLQKRAAIELEKKCANDAFKARLTEASDAIELLAREVASGKESRAIECKERGDYLSGMVDTVRLDSGEIVARRPMRPDERQLSMQTERRMPPRKPKAQPPPDNDNNDNNDDDDFAKGMQ